MHVQWIFVVFGGVRGLSDESIVPADRSVLEVEFAPAG